LSKVIKSFAVVGTRNSLRSYKLYFELLPLYNFSLLYIIRGQLKHVPDKPWQMCLHCFVLEAFLLGRCLMRTSLSKGFENVCLKATIWSLCWLTLSHCTCSCCKLSDSIKLFCYAQLKVWNLGTVFTGLALVKSMLKR